MESSSGLSCGPEASPHSFTKTSTWALRLLSSFLRCLAWGFPRSLAHACMTVSMSCWPGRCISGRHFSDVCYYNNGFLAQNLVCAEVTHVHCISVLYSFLHAKSRVRLRAGLQVRSAV